MCVNRWSSARRAASWSAALVTTLRSCISRLEMAEANPSGSLVA